ncbi:MAG: response regulator transcription factor [Chloroflexi bacterium]|nr:response regulator transcription factor [Chloroflexota bacterium]
MLRVLLVTGEGREAEELRAKLTRAGFECLYLSEGDASFSGGQSPDFALVEINGGSDERNRELFHWLKTEKHLPVIVLLDKSQLENLDSAPPVDDFIIKPLDVTELLLRARRLLPGSKKTGTGGELITRGDLFIDLAACEVTVGGRLVPLTFKEYELLKYLAGNKGRVFTREGLLNKVWGYDYYGGDRTVDVHITRLRSKIEDAGHTFIETVRNIGYRFRDDL